MTDADLFAFAGVFKGLLAVFPKRMDEHEIGALSRAYFTALRRFSVPQIQAGADVWVQRGKFFPKPAEWSDAVPRASAAAGANLSVMSGAEVAEYLDAERRRYDGEPCRCGECRRAGVDHRFLRFVPDVDADGNDLRALIGEREVCRGHWAHGDELRRWYAAKEKFWAQFARAIKGHAA